MNNIKTRVVAEQDLPFLKSMVEKEWPRYSTGFEKEVLGYIPPNGVCLVATISDQIVGLGCIEISSMSYAVWSLTWMLVAHENRGTGVGRVIVDDLERFATKNMDERETELSICLTTSHARLFYEKLGYQEVVRFRGNNGNGKDGIRYLMWKNVLHPELSSHDKTPSYSQPTYVNLWNAFVCGAREARMNPQATEHDFNRSADAYCKMVHSELDPVFFRQLGENDDGCKEQMQRGLVEKEGNCK